MLTFFDSKFFNKKHVSTLSILAVHSSFKVHSLYECITWSRGMQLAMNLILVYSEVNISFLREMKMDEILEMKLKTDRENTPVKARARETQAQSLCRETEKHFAKYLRNNRST